MIGGATSLILRTQGTDSQNRGLNPDLTAETTIIITGTMAILTGYVISLVKPQKLRKAVACYNNNF
jgi:hypothetical protein